MNILMLCTKFSVVESDGWLTNELAGAFAKSGHFVQVICVDWAAKLDHQPQTLVTSLGVRVVMIPPLSMKVFGRKMEKVVKWLFSSLNARKAAKQLTKERKFDLLIVFSPAVTMMTSLLAIIKQPNVKSYYVLWDFFPYHHRQIGLIKGYFAFLAAKRIEEYLIRKFDLIGCMSEMNIDYLKSHYRLKSNQKTQILPLWGNSAVAPITDKTLTRMEFKLPTEGTIAVFGGQLTIGRGIEEILSVANVALQNRDNILFLFVGNGPYTTLIRESIIHGASNIIILDWVPRDRYLQLLSACDIALVCTVRNVDVPTFPSKTVDYFKASLPIVASVEASTDYGTWIERLKSGYSSRSGDLGAFYGNIKRLSCDPITRSIFGRNGNDYFNKEMNVSATSSSILKVFPSIEDRNSI